MAGEKQRKGLDVQTIWKYPLKITDTQVVTMPKGAEILSAQMQGDGLCVWAKVDSGEPSEDVMFFVHGTGHGLTSPEAKYLDTFQMRGGTLVFHVFYKPTPSMTKGE